MANEISDPKKFPLGRLIHIVSRKLKKEDLIPGEELGLTPIQSHVLKHILFESLHRTLYQKDIEEEFQIRRSTATGILQLMEKNGFIRRETSKADARLKQIIPTKKAEALREAIFESIVQREQKMSQGIPEEELAICRKVLEDILLNLT